MTSFEYQMEYISSGPMTLNQFLEQHRTHEIIECDDDAMFQMPTSVSELRQMCGDRAVVEYLGEESPFFLDNDGLFFGFFEDFSGKKVCSCDQVRSVYLGSWIDHLFLIYRCSQSKDAKSTLENRAV